MRSKTRRMAGDIDRHAGSSQVASRARFAALALAFLSLACQTAPPPRPVSEAGTSRSARRARSVARERAIQAVSNLEIPRPDGGTFTLSELRGKVVVVDFWATYCPPCVKQAPRLAELRTRYRDRGLEIVGVSLNPREDNPEVTRFIKQAGINYPVGYADQRISAAFLSGTEDETGLPPIPQLFVLARDGRLVEHLVGEDPEQGLAQLEKIVDQQLSLSAASH